MKMGWRRLALLLACFAGWSLLGTYAYPIYSEVLVPASSAFLTALEPHDLKVTYVNEHTWLTYYVQDADGEPQMGRLSLVLQVYNSVLYLTLLTAWPGVTTRGRLLFALTGIPLVFLFQVVDLAMALEGRILSMVHPEHADFLGHFSLWFSLVKFYNFLSIMAIKQIIFAGLFALQCFVVPRWAPWAVSRR